MLNVMNPWQFRTRWLLEVTVIAGIYCLIVRGALYSAPPYCDYWRVLLLGLTIQIVIGTFEGLSTGTLFYASCSDRNR